MPFKALRGGDPVYPEQIEDTDAEFDCFDCDEVVKIRESHTRGESFVARHFWHPSGTPDGCEAVGGESWKHQRMKSIAASKAKTRWPDASVQLEQQVGERRADVLVVFDEFHHRYGNGIAIEAQHKHENKEIESVEADFQANRCSVLWLWEEQYEGKDVDFDDGDWSVWWAKAVPSRDEWSGFHGVIHWLKQEQRPSVELEVTFPAGIPDDAKPSIGQAWRRGKAKREREKRKKEEWNAVCKTRLGRGVAFFTFAEAPDTNDPFLVLSKGRGRNNEIIHVPFQTSRNNAKSLRELSTEIVKLRDRNGNYVDKSSDDWETEAEVWFDTLNPESVGLLELFRPPDGSLGFRLKEIKDGSREEVGVAKANFDPEQMIRAARKIADKIDIVSSQRGQSP